MKKGRISNELVSLLYEDSDEQLNEMGVRTLKSMDEGKALEIFGTLDHHEVGKQINSWNKGYAVSGNVIAIILEGEGEEVPVMVRKMVGRTDPAKADKGTIRGDFANDSIYEANSERRTVRNLVHASEPNRAETEIKLFEENFF